jgi:hypothetical protein
VSHPSASRGQPSTEWPTLSNPRIVTSDPSKTPPS